MKQNTQNGTSITKRIHKRYLYEIKQSHTKHTTMINFQFCQQCRWGRGGRPHSLPKSHHSYITLQNRLF